MKEKHKKKIWFNTALLKEKSAACTMVCCYIEELVEGYYPFADTTFDIMSNLINFIYNQDSSFLPFLFISFFPPFCSTNKQTKKD